MIPPKVTIAIPTYNRLTYLRQAIDSALAQTYPELEVIVSDNCSNDGTAESVRSIRDPRLIFVQQERNLGMIGNWNICLQRATGGFFLLLSDDDYLDPTAIQKLVDAVIEAKNPEHVGVAYCRTWLIDAKGDKLGVGPVPPSCEKALEFAMGYFRGTRPIYPACTMMRTDDLRFIGGYAQSSVQLAVDAVAFSRILLSRGEIVAVPESLAFYRMHLTSATSSSHILTWQRDIRALIALWAAGFESAAPEQRRRFIEASRKYESWNIAANINRSATSFRTRVRALAAYWLCRGSFKGLIGKWNWLTGLLKMLLPEWLRKLGRAFLVWRQTSDWNQHRRTVESH